MRHRIKHHVNRPVLHMGMFTDAQMLPAAGLFTVAAGWLYAGGGALVGRALVAAVLLLPVAVMVVDNRVGGIVTERVAAYVRWHRQPGVFEPGARRCPWLRAQRRRRGPAAAGARAARPGRPRGGLRAGRLR